MSRTLMSALACAFSVLNCQSLCYGACGDTEQDRLVWARERMHPNISQKQMELVYQWLKNGTHSCPLSGDLWYYRGLVAKRLLNDDDARYAFGKADENGSTGEAKGFDPFNMVAHATSAPNAVHEKYALLVGVTKFEKSFDFLEYSGKDAHELGDYLIASASFKKENVKVLTDKEATTASIREAFGDIRAKAKADDLVLVYISSHGRERDLDPTGLSYILTYDTDTFNSAKVFASALQMVELAELGRWVLAKDYVLLLDTCYSGAAHAGVGASSGGGLDPLQGLEGSGNRVVISASRGDEPSYEDPGSKHGYFTRFLLDGLKNKGPGAPLSSLFEFLSSNVTMTVAQQGGHQQHPVMQSYGQGQEIVLNAPLLAAAFSHVRRFDWDGRR